MSFAVWRENYETFVRPYPSELFSTSIGLIYLNVLRGGIAADSSKFENGFLDRNSPISYTIEINDHYRAFMSLGVSRYL